MKHLVIFLVALILASCATQRPATTEQRTTDTEYITRRYLDSLFVASMKRDSVFMRDSIYVFQNGDTITQYVEKIRYRYQNRTDTLYRNIVARDTVFVERTDSVAVDRPVYIEKQLKWHQRGFIWLGRLCCIAALLWVLFLYLRRKL